MAYTPPPWRLSYQATAEQLHTADMIKVLDRQVGAQFIKLRAGGAPSALQLHCNKPIVLFCRLAAAVKFKCPLTSLL